MRTISWEAARNVLARIKQRNRWNTAARAVDFAGVSAPSTVGARRQAEHLSRKHLYRGSIAVVAEMVQRHSQPVSGRDKALNLVGLF